LATLNLHCSTPSTHNLTPYLVFPGSCRTALEFYAECLNGEIVMLQTFAEASIDVPAELGERIFNAEFQAGGVHFKASDDMPGKEVAVGSNFALFVTFADQAEKERVFTRLSEGGTVLFPIEDNFGMLVDKFGIRWMLESRE